MAPGWYVGRTDGRIEEISTRCRIDTINELEYYQHGGILHYVLRQLLSGRQKPKPLSGAPAALDESAVPTNSRKVDEGSKESFPASDPPAY